MDFNTIKRAIESLPKMREPIKSIPVSQGLYDHFVEQARNNPQPDTWRHPRYDGIELIVDPELTGMSFKMPETNPFIDLLNDLSEKYKRRPEDTYETWRNRNIGYNTFGNEFIL